MSRGGSSFAIGLERMATQWLTLVDDVRAFCLGFGISLRTVRAAAARILCLLWERPLLDGRARLGKLNRASGPSDAPRPADLSGQIFPI